MGQILLIHCDRDFLTGLVTVFEEEGFLPALSHSPTQALGLILSGPPPDVIVVELALENWGGLRLCETIRREGAFGHVAIVAILPPTDEALPDGFSWEEPPFDDYLTPPIETEQLVHRIRLSLVRNRRHLDANPLTRLPGNNTIMHELERRMEAAEEFAVAYIDLDNFKAFNDKYGFPRGDEALRLTARLLVNLVGALGPGVGFVGHVGGDDFVFIAPANRAAQVAGQIVDHFDSIIISLYDDVDRARGCIVSKNRRGETEEFPIMTISLAVIPNRGGRLRHLGQISAIAADLKKKAKMCEGSTVVIDRRRKAPVDGE
ncbi:diguanylate cyclase [Candidatus Sumerlaeota bacterium]|nr:diguanylate cyclase [Candidatus Sumerlaeota bacterium]